MFASQFCLFYLLNLLMILKWCFAFKSVFCVYAIFDCSFYLICITKYITPLCLVAHYILKYVIYLSTFGDSAFESQKNIVWRKNVLQEAYTLWSKHLSNYVKKVVFTVSQ